MIHFKHQPDFQFVSYLKDLSGWSKSFEKYPSKRGRQYPIKSFINFNNFNVPRVDLNREVDNFDVSNHGSEQFYHQ